jgi:hypothetical protein
MEYGWVTTSKIRIDIIVTVGAFAIGEQDGIVELKPFSLIVIIGEWNQCDPETYVD